jgi:hypothetical protein
MPKTLAAFKPEPPKRFADFVALADRIRRQQHELDANLRTLCAGLDGIKASGRKGELRSLRQKLSAPSPPRRLDVILPELHDPATGRIDGRKLADHIGVPLKRLAEGLRLNYKAAHRAPSALAFQRGFKPVKRIAEILHEFFPKSELARVWLNTPHPDLDRQTALELILANKPDAVLRLLENAVAGVPV